MTNMLKVFFLLTGFTCLALCARGQNILKATSGAVIKIEAGAGFYINGGLVLDDGSSFTNNGFVTLDGTGVTDANFTDNTSGSYHYGTGSFLFYGSGAQTLKSNNQFQVAQVNNAGLSLLSNASAGSWVLKTGKITTGPFMIVATATASTAMIADASNPGFQNAWVHGSVRRYVAPALVNEYVFPVGDAAKANIAEMTNLTADPLNGITYITASFGAKPGTDAGLNASETGMVYAAVNNGGVWYLTPDATPAGGKYDLNVFFGGFSGLIDNQFGLLRRPDASSNGADWSVPAGSTLPLVNQPGRMLAAGYARRNSLTGFSQFAIGSTANVALPLRLLHFYASSVGENIELKWTTTNEVNTANFQLLKGRNSTAMQNMATVAAAGNSATKTDYYHLDKQPFAGANYYQLKMVDRDGSFTLSKMVVIKLADNEKMIVYPNPVVGRTVFATYAGNEKIRAASLVAYDGKLLGCTIVSNNPGQVVLQLPANIAKGSYLMQLVTAAKSMTTKILVE